MSYSTDNMSYSTYNSLKWDQLVKIKVNIPMPIEYFYFVKKYWAEVKDLNKLGIYVTITSMQSLLLVIKLKLSKKNSQVSTNANESLPE